MTDEELQAAIDEAVKMTTAEQKLSALERLRTSVLSERRILRVLTVMATVTAAVGVSLSLQSLSALNRFEDERASRARGSCIQYNEQQDRSREGNKRQLRVVIEGLTTGRRTTPEGQARIDALYLLHDEAMDAAFPHRDCTPDGIEAYLEAQS